MHELWHVVVLAAALLGAAAALLLAAIPLLFETPPPGLTGARPVVLGLVGVAAGIVLVEWQWVH